MKKPINLFNQTSSNCEIIKVKDEYGYDIDYKFDYYKNGELKYNQQKIEEMIYLPNVEQNMFIDLYNRGRYGNYINGAVLTVGILLEFEKIYSNKSYEQIVSEIKNNKSTSKLYSKYNCEISNCGQSCTKDKYYFQTNGVESFKYFNCHHFHLINDNPVICQDGIDIVIEYKYKNKIPYPLDNCYYKFFI
jgi:hypothetical protein